MKKIRTWIIVCVGAIATAAGTVAAVAATTMAAVSVAKASFTTVREVELTFVDNALVILAQALGQFQTFTLSASGAQQTRCTWPSKAWLSYDKTLVVSSNASGRVTATHPITCAVVAEISLPITPLDADVHLGSQRIVSAISAGQGWSLFLHDFQGARVADLGVVRNAEIGFSPDGASVINFDQTTGSPDVWRARDGVKSSLTLPRLAFVHFSGDGQWFFTSRPGTFTAHTWPGYVANSSAGKPGNHAVLRGVSQHGNTLIFQSPNPTKPSYPNVELLDRHNGAHQTLGQGHIDATALRQDGKAWAIAIRAQKSEQIEISLHSSERQLFVP